MNRAWKYCRQAGPDEMAEGGSIWYCRPLNYRTAKTGRAVNDSAFAPFILAVDRLGRVCYFYLSSIVDGVTE